MDASFPGLGTVINIATVVVGALLGMAVGHRFPDRTRSVVTDCLGLTTLLMAGLSAVSVTDRALSDATGRGAPVLIVLGSLLIGSIAGSLLRIGDRLVQPKLAALLEAIAVVAAGDALIAPSITRRLIERFAALPGPAPDPGDHGLTDREREVLVAVSEGLSNQEVADRLALDELAARYGVENPVARLLTALGIA